MKSSLVSKLACFHVNIQTDLAQVVDTPDGVDGELRAGWDALRGLIADIVVEGSAELSANFAQQLKDATAEHERHLRIATCRWEASYAQLGLQVRALREAVEQQRGTITEGVQSQTRAYLDNVIADVIPQIKSYVEEAVKTMQESENTLADDLKLRMFDIEDRLEATEDDLADHMAQCSRENAAMQHSTEEGLLATLNSYNSYVNSNFAVVQESIRDANAHIKEIELAIADLNDQVADLENEEAECSRLLDIASTSSQKSTTSSDDGDSVTAENGECRSEALNEHPVLSMPAVSTKCGSGNGITTDDWMDAQVVFPFEKEDCLSSL